MQLIRPPQDRLSQLLNQQRAAFAGFNSLSALSETSLGKQHRFDFRSPTKDEMEEMLDTDTTFRWLHIPFVIAELVWDRLDTVKIVSQMLKLEHTRKINRQIDEIHRVFNSKKRILIEGDCHSKQAKHGEEMLDEMEKDLSTYYQSIYKVICEKFTELDNDNRMFVAAIHEARLIYMAVRSYNEKFRSILRRDFGLTTKDIMPAEFWQLGELMTKIQPEHNLPISGGVMKDCITQMVQMMFDIQLMTDNGPLKRTINI